MSDIHVTNFTPLTSQKAVKPKKNLFYLLVPLTFVLVVAIGLVSYLIYSKKPITTEKKAYVVTIGPHDSCNKLTIAVAESTQCEPLVCSNNVPETTRDISSYSATYSISSNDEATHSFTYTKRTDFCTEACGQGDQTGRHCWDNTQISDPQNGTVTSSTPLLIEISRSSPNGIACGTFQTDFFISQIDDDSSCTYGASINGPGAATLCQTGISCSSISPTPTVTPTVTPTATPTIGPSATPTPTSPVPTSPGMLNCGSKGCDNNSTGLNKCKDGLTCVKANNENSWFCSMPQLTTSCQSNPNFDNCCSTPTTSTPTPIKPTIPQTGESRMWYLIPLGIILVGLFL